MTRDAGTKAEITGAAPTLSLGVGDPGEFTDTPKHTTRPINKKYIAWLSDDERGVRHDITGSRETKTFPNAILRLFARPF